MSALKIKEFPTVARTAPEAIEKNQMEQQLRGAQFKLDRMLHDLRSEFIARENKIRDEYLSEIQTIAGGAE